MKIVSIYNNDTSKIHPDLNRTAPSQQKCLAKIRKIQDYFKTICQKEKIS